MDTFEGKSLKEKGSKLRNRKKKKNSVDANACAVIEEKKIAGKKRLKRSETESARLQASFCSYFFVLDLFGIVAFGFLF